MMPYQFSVNYWRNNKQFLTFLSFIIIVNIVLFVTRAVVRAWVIAGRPPVLVHEDERARDQAFRRLRPEEDGGEGRDHGREECREENRR